MANRELLWGRAFHRAGADPPVVSWADDLFMGGEDFHRVPGAAAGSAKGACGFHGCEFGSAQGLVDAVLATVKDGCYAEGVY